MLIAPRETWGFGFPTLMHPKGVLHIFPTLMHPKGVLHISYNPSRVVCFFVCKPHVSRGAIRQVFAYFYRKIFFIQHFLSMIIDILRQLTLFEQALLTLFEQALIRRGRVIILNCFYSNAVFSSNRFHSVNCSFDSR